MSTLTARPDPRRPPRERRTAAAAAAEVLPAADAPRRRHPGARCRLGERRVRRRRRRRAAPARGAAHRRPGRHRPGRGTRRAARSAGSTWPRPPSPRSRPPPRPSAPAAVPRREVAVDLVDADLGGPFTAVPLLGAGVPGRRPARRRRRRRPLPPRCAPPSLPEPAAPRPARLPQRGIEMLHGVDMEVTVELGRTRMTVRDLLALSPGEVLELDRAAGSPADLLVNGRLIARGEVVVVDEDFGLRDHRDRRRERSRLTCSSCTVRLIASLAVVVGLMLLLARLVGKRYGARAGAPVQVLHRQAALAQRLGRRHHRRRPRAGGRHHRPPGQPADRARPRRAGPSPGARTSASSPEPATLPTLLSTVLPVAQPAVVLDPRPRRPAPADERRHARRLPPGDARPAPYVTGRRGAGGLGALAADLARGHRGRHGQGVVTARSRVAHVLAACPGHAPRPPGVLLGLTAAPAAAAPASPAAAASRTRR